MHSGHEWTHCLILRWTSRIICWTAEWAGVSDKRGYVLVTDSNNNNIQILNPSLGYLSDVTVTKYKLNDPFPLNLDELNNRLYVGEWDGGRVLVLAYKQI